MDNFDQMSKFLIFLSEMKISGAKSEKHFETDFKTKELRTRPFATSQSFIHVVG